MKSKTQRALPIFKKKSPLCLYIGIATLIVALSACSTIRKVTPLPSENFNSRVAVIVIHHTSANFEESVDILTKASSNSVSSHYLVPDPSDKSFTESKLEVYQLVPESERAWHAGRSYWAGKSGLNDQSIGIEIVNQSYCRDPDLPEMQSSDLSASASSMPTMMETAEQPGAKPPKRLCFYPDFPETQMAIVIDLVKAIQKRHPRVEATHIIGHSDIAPSRKVDPGPRFPWERLYQLGIGAWFDDATVTKYWRQFTTQPMPLINIQKALHVYGYKIDQTGILDEQTRDVLRAFQLHFRPHQVTGKPTLETTAILFALIEKYRADHLEELLTIAALP